MGTDALGYTLGLLTLGMSMIAARNRNMLLTLGAAALWTTFLAFILANTAAGTNWQSLFVISAFTFMMAFALITFIGRVRNGRVSNWSGNSESSKETEVEGRGLRSTDRSLMDYSEDEYRRFIYRKLHKPLRRRR